MIHNGHAYAVGSPGVLCVKLDTGKIAWREKAGTAEISSPILADGKVFAFGGGGIVVLNAAPDGYKVFGKMRMPVVQCTSPAIVDGRLFVRVKNGVACYDLRKEAAAASDKKAG